MFFEFYDLDLEVKERSEVKMTSIFGFLTPKTYNSVINSTWPFVTFDLDLEVKERLAAEMTSIFEFLAPENI